MTAHREPGWVELLARVLRDTPKLPGALCVQRSVIFDADQDDPEEREYAIARAKPESTDELECRNEESAL